MPGIILSEIALALSKSAAVTRIEIDLGTHPTVGLHRAPSLAAAHGEFEAHRIVRHTAPANVLIRKKALRSWIGPDVGLAIAYVWPGIDNSWVDQFLRVAKSAGASAIVLCESLPESKKAKAISLVSNFAAADLIVVGDRVEARDLGTVFGAFGPAVFSHSALSLRGRGDRSTRHEITAILSKDNHETLSTVLAAFDAIPNARIRDYNLQIVMRYDGHTVPRMVKNSHHRDHVQLLRDDISGVDLKTIFDASSALTLADPSLDSRAYATAVGAGVATVVLSNAPPPFVGRGYVGGFVANRRQPASVNVALAHALRLAELGFPSPEAWDDLADRITPHQHLEHPATLESTSEFVSESLEKRLVKNALFVEPQFG
jgi:hypothetical protein